MPSRKALLNTWKYKTKKGSDRRSAADHRHTAIADTHHNRGSYKEKIGS
jgi:hypothetical protein